MAANYEHDDGDDHIPLPLLAAQHNFSHSPRSVDTSSPRSRSDSPTLSALSSTRSSNNDHRINVSTAHDRSTNSKSTLSAISQYFASCLNPASLFKLCAMLLVGTVLLIGGLNAYDVYTTTTDHLYHLTNTLTAQLRNSTQTITNLQQRLNTLDTQLHDQTASTIDQLQNRVAALDSQFNNHTSQNSVEYKEVMRQVKELDALAVKSRLHDLTINMGQLRKRVDTQITISNELAFPFIWGAVFVVTLRPERYLKFTTQWETLWPEMWRITYPVMAVHGDTLDTQAMMAQGLVRSDLETLDKDGYGVDRKMTRGEIGCALSHFHAWQRCVDLGLNYCLILEDDAEITRERHEETFRGLHQKLKDANLLDFDVLYLGWSWGGTKPIDGTSEFVKPDNILYTVLHSYVVSAKGAAKLIKYQYPINMPVDMYAAQLNHDGVPDEKRVNAIMHQPSLVSTFTTSWSDTQGIR